MLSYHEPFSIESGNAVLRGNTRTPSKSMYFTIFRLGGIAAWTVISLFATLGTDLWWFPYAGEGMFAFGMLFFYFVNKKVQVLCEGLHRDMKSALERDA